MLSLPRSSSKAVISVFKVSTFFSASDFSAGFGASGFVGSTGASLSLTPPSYSGTSTLGVASSPLVPIVLLYSENSFVGVSFKFLIFSKVSLYSSVSLLISSVLACNDSLTSSNLALASLVSASNLLSASCKASRTAWLLLFFLAVSTAALTFSKVSFCFSKLSAFVVESALSFSATFANFSIFSAKSSAISVSFATIGLEASLL